MEWIRQYTVEMIIWSPAKFLSGLFRKKLADWNFDRISIGKKNNTQYEIYKMCILSMEIYTI